MTADVIRIGPRVIRVTFVRTYEVEGAATVRGVGGASARRDVHVSLGHGAT
jgi:hypothetical protein